MTSPVPDFGEATYVSGRHRKNPVLIYTSRTDRNKVYEFMIATKYKIPGLVSWKCVSCSKVKNGYRNLGAELKRKVPLILVDNDIIKEDPEKPLNAEHFCNGKDAVDAVLDRARIEFVHRHGNKEPSSARIHETIHDFAREAASTAPIPLNMKEKRHVQRTLDAKCLPLLHGVSKRRRWKLRKESCNGEQYERDEEAILELGEGPSSLNLDLHSLSELGAPSKPLQSMREERGFVEESPRKRLRKVNRYPPQSTPAIQTVMVRPLPPYNYPRQPTPSELQRRMQDYQQQRKQREQQQQRQQAPINYFDGSGVGEGFKHIFGDEELILGDQQQVAYSIEL